jgi:hypothetical protein
MNKYLAKYLGKNETWVTNVDSDNVKTVVESYHNQGYKSARAGIQAFDVKGKRIKRDEQLPVFMNPVDARNWLHSNLYPKGGNEGEK